MNGEPLRELQEQIARAARLEEMGVVVRSAELRERAGVVNEFVSNGGNRAMRRAAKRAMRRRGQLS